MVPSDGAALMPGAARAHIGPTTEKQFKFCDPASSLSLLPVVTPARRRATGSARFDGGRFRAARQVPQRAHNPAVPGSSPGAAIPRCSECGGHVLLDRDGESYCPRCGVVV